MHMRVGDVVHAEVGLSRDYCVCVRVCVFESDGQFIPCEPGAAFLLQLEWLPSVHT